MMNAWPAFNRLSSHHLLRVQWWVFKQTFYHVWWFKKYKIEYMYYVWYFKSIMYFISILMLIFFSLQPVGLSCHKGRIRLWCSCHTFWEKFLVFCWNTLYSMWSKYLIEFDHKDTSHVQNGSTLWQTCPIETQQNDISLIWPICFGY